MIATCHPERKYCARGMCKMCYNSWHRHANPAMYIAAGQRYRKKHPEPRLDHVKRFYNISPEQYRDILNEQGGLCKICRQPDTRQLSVDHDHETGNIRGLLCRSCNTLLGDAREDIGILIGAALYLQDFARGVR